MVGVFDGMNGLIKIHKELLYLEVIQFKIQNQITCLHIQMLLQIQIDLHNSPMLNIILVKRLKMCAK